MGAPQSVGVDHLGHANVCKVLLDDAKQCCRTMGGAELDSVRDYQMRELTADRAPRHNELQLERSLVEAYVLLEGQRRAHSEELETMRIRLREMMDRHKEDMQYLEGLICFRLHSLQSALDHEVRKNEKLLAIEYIVES